MNPPWWHQPITGFDTETTGPDPFADRIVTAAVTRVNTDGATTTRQWLLNPETPISDGAARVHGITTEHAREHGQDYATGIREIRDALALAATETVALAAFNAAFDFTLLHSECARLGIPPLPPTPVLDAMVLDRHLNSVRRIRGRKFNLAASCEHWGVTLTDAHSADADAIAAVQVARALLDAAPTTLTPAEMHASQKNMRRTQQQDIQAWKARSGDRIPVSLDWPVMEPAT